MVVDLLQAARNRDHDRLIVIGDDDDLLPGVLAAEQWGAKIDVLRLFNLSGLPFLTGKGAGFPVTMMRANRLVMA